MVVYDYDCDTTHYLLDHGGNPIVLEYCIANLLPALRANFTHKTKAKQRNIAQGKIEKILGERFYKKSKNV